MVKLELLILNPLKLISEFWMNRTIKDFLLKSDIHTVVLSITIF